MNPLLLTPLLLAAVVPVDGPRDQALDLAAGAGVEIAVQLTEPARLPANARLAVVWSGPRPELGWRKQLHALDSSVAVVYRAPVAGRYMLKIEPLVDGPWPGDASPRWREKGTVAQMMPLPRQTPWLAGTVTPVRIDISPIDLAPADQESARHIIAVEPNDTPALAQPLTLAPRDGETLSTWEISGAGDLNEFFDNGQPADDWFRITYTGQEPRLLTVQLATPDPVIAHRVRCYVPDAKGQDGVAEFTEGRDPNERSHQQDEEHRASINRLLKPGGTYLLRVEANSPFYTMQLRLVPPGPYTDPRLAIRQGMYTQIAQVDAWLTNRPRGASLDRRLRDTGNLLGTNCMSCHTHSGVWGPAGPLAAGYPLENELNYRHLLQLMYECLRPTNVLKDAANNTSLAPLDLGDGPAGTRVAGFNIVTAERLFTPKKLHAPMQVRTANFVLQSADPGGINAAGPGSNIGRVIVAQFATTIVKQAWETTSEVRYFRALEEKFRGVLTVEPKFTDDVALRLDYFHTLVPPMWYLAQAKRAAEIEKKPFDEAAALDLVTRARQQCAADEKRLRDGQNPDGSWGFNPDGPPKEKREPKKDEPAASDPSPTALAILGLQAAGAGVDDPAIARGVKALLAMQEPAGRWNKSAQTGFVTSAYALNALARLYPAEPTKPTPLPEGTSLPATLERVRRLALNGEATAEPALIDAAQHESMLVRAWAMVGLGLRPSAAAVPALVAALADPARPVRYAASWALRQNLLDDHGWTETFAAAESADDTSREQAMQALVMRADAVLSRSTVDWARLGRLFDRALNDDPHPAVRAWASKAAWPWWVWNPPVREAINAAWVRLLERPEANALVENTVRYSSHALFIANGHKANGSGQHQYPELAKLFAALTAELDDAEPAIKQRLARRLVGIGATFFSLAGGDGGPGQMGYATPGAGAMMGRAGLMYLEDAVKTAGEAVVRLGLEGASGVPDRDLTEFVVHYSLTGPESLRQLAANAVGDPRSAKLPAVPEQVEPQLAQVLRGANEPPRRSAVSDPILTLWSKVQWVIPSTEEQQRNFFSLMVPKLDRYPTPAELAQADAAGKAALERQAEATWYLADRLGEVFETNPDLHHDLVFRVYFPKEITNPAQTHFWLRSAGWLLTHQPASMPTGDVQTVRDRALQLYLDSLTPQADPRTRKLAVRMANQTALRRNPEVLLALERLPSFEKDKASLQAAANVLKQGREKFLPDLLAVLKKERDPSVAFDAAGNPKPTPEQLADIEYFRDFVMPELVRQKREDSKSCLECHGVPGRVPSLTMKPTDQFGYQSVNDLMVNYRLLQKRVTLTDIPRSPLLRKPLNVQDGQEDGHQGGRRYAPTDEGYLLLKRWAEQQPAVQRK